MNMAALPNSFCRPARCCASRCFWSLMRFCSSLLLMLALTLLLVLFYLCWVPGAPTVVYFCQGGRQTGPATIKEFPDLSKWPQQLTEAISQSGTAPGQPSRC